MVYPVFSFLFNMFRNGFNIEFFLEMFRKPVGSKNTSMLPAGASETN